MKADAVKVRKLLDGQVLVGFAGSAADSFALLERVEAKLRAGAHFLVTDVIYDVEEASRALGALRARGVSLPVLATLAPFEDIQTLQRLSYEVPEVSIPLSVLAAAKRNRDKPTEIVEHAVGVVEKLRNLISGVVVHVPSGADELAAQLVNALSQLQAKPRPQSLRQTRHRHGITATEATDANARIVSVNEGGSARKIGAAVSNMSNSTTTAASVEDFGSQLMLWLSCQP